MAKCLVLGGNGFIGSHLVDELIVQGHEVTVFCREYSNRHMNSHAKYCYGDFMNTTDINRSISGNEFVFHCITLTNPAISENNPYIDLDTNVRMTVQLLESCVENGIKRIIFPSSGGAIYGENTKGIYSESDATMPMSPYAIGKQTIEGYLRYFNKKHKLDYLILRISNVYGFGQNTSGGKHGVVSVFLENAIQDKPVIVLGDGTMVRDYIYIDDLIDILTKMSFLNTKHKLYNVGAGKGESLNEVILEIENILNRKIKKKYIEKPSSYVDKIILDCTRLNNEFNLAPSISLSKGIELLFHKTKNDN